MESTVDITSLAFGGNGIGRIGGKVVFVPFTAPGDVARVRITSEKKGYSEGVLADLVSPSPEREKPECGYFGVCGGCALQHMKYHSQVEWKQRILEETLKRIGRVVPEAFDAPEPSPAAYNYRSRARFQIKGRSWGFFESKSHSVVDIEACPILSPLINTVFGGLKLALSGKETGLYSVEIGVSEKDGKAVASFHAGGDTGFQWKKALSGIDDLKGFEVWADPLKKDKGRRIFAEDDGSLLYEASGLSFSAGISVFSQVNRFQNQSLVRKVIDYAGLSGRERVLDLFSGVGNLSLPLAARAADTTGVESSGEAAKEAAANAEFNKIAAVRFIRDDAGRWLRNNIKALEKERPDVVVLDPPRGGEPEVAKALSGLRPKRIIYVSCSPPTLARDLSKLTGCGYRVFRAGLFDMFPQTYHIESIAGLESVDR